MDCCTTLKGSRNLPAAVAGLFGSVDTCEGKRQIGVRLGSGLIGTPGCETSDLVQPFNGDNKHRQGICSMPPTSRDWAAEVSAAFPMLLIL